jgi:hypothetical protein
MDASEFTRHLEQSSGVESGDIPFDGGGGEHGSLVVLRQGFALSNDMAERIGRMQSNDCRPETHKREAAERLHFPWR